MWTFLIVLFIILGCLFLIRLIFGLMRAGRRADEGEEKLLDIMDNDDEEGRS